MNKYNFSKSSEKNNKITTCIENILQIDNFCNTIIPTSEFTVLFKKKLIFFSL